MPAINFTISLEQLKTTIAIIIPVIAGFFAIIKYVASDYDVQVLRNEMNISSNDTLKSLLYLKYNKDGETLPLDSWTVEDQEKLNQHRELGHTFLKTKHELKGQNKAGLPE